MPIVGEKFNSLTVLEVPSKDSNWKALFRCDCGIEKWIRYAHVSGGATVSCGCVKVKVAIPAGFKSGRLIVIDGEVQRRNGVRSVEVLCECGVRKLIDIWQVANKRVQSCGCLVVETAKALAFRHGEEGSALYRVWHGMKGRCSTPSAGPYARYGGRGIQVCSQWSDDYVNFRDWAISSGYAKGLQIDRIDNDGDYEPCNCRWVTPITNANNRGNHRLLTAWGETKTVSEWSRDPRCVVTVSALKQRAAKRKMTDEEMLTLTGGEARRNSAKFRQKPKRILQAGGEKH